MATTQNAAVVLYCPNSDCQYPNSEFHNFCHKCRTPLLKRYLWIAGQGLENNLVGDLLQDRFLVKSANILLDTQPNLANAKLSISDAVEPYLKLFHHRPHIPQAYCLLHLDQGQSSRKLLLLEQAPLGQFDLPVNSDSDLNIGSAMPLAKAWQSASTLRQLNWLWQIAQLWQPLSEQGVVSSLLDPELLRVEGSVVRLLELHSDEESAPTLAQLGQVWSRLLLNAGSAIANGLETLCQRLIWGRIQAIEQVIEQLERWLTIVGRDRTNKIEIATRTDKGPTRQRNEDACYPAPSETTIRSPLTVVCDGVGGHAGGDVASDLAIQTITHYLQTIQLETATPQQIMGELENAIYIANDLISQHNNNQQQQGTQRMGTTLAIALAHAHQMYIAHVGDSRVYWITRNGCYQVTCDDNIACQWVQLGYGSYRDIRHHPAAALLVQALGATASSVLRPTLRRFILDEDCIFLLCSDGLSDNDRVEEHWKTEILPILDDQISPGIASKRLVELANCKNGHDNVTVSLAYCQIS